MQTTKTIDIKKFNNAVGFTATFRQWGNRRKADIDLIQSDADKSRLGLSKQLIQSDEYDAIKSYFGQLRQWLYSRTVPSFFKEGFQLASLEAVEAIEARMRKAVAEDLPPLVAALVKEYPAKVAMAELALGSQFRATDYPTATELAEQFGLQWYWIAFTTPEALPPELRAAEEAKMKEQIADAGEQIIDAMRTALAGLIAHAVDKLTPGADGKSKVFRDSLIGNIQAFIETFPSRNFMGDTDLASLVEKAKTVLAGAEPDKLRKYSAVREETAAAFKEIQGTLDTMIETRKSRQFDLAD
ncbi:MAG TPA: hypothetical protein VMQ76_07235 [Terracidiphilus sp.]|nr:hypothetical protein [Terracidiphilus sp.]